MTRLARLKRPELDDDQKLLFDEITTGERAKQQTGPPRLSADGALDGPFNAMLYSARIGHAMQSLGAQVRYHSTLSDRCREIAILTTASAWDSPYERYAHEGIARAVGLTDHELAAIRIGADPSLVEPTERAVLAVARCLANHHDLDDDEYAAAIDTLGERMLVELVFLVGYYASIALSLRAFRIVPLDF